MSKFLCLPRLGETMEEGEVVAWVKQVGQLVKRGETIVEIQTDKIVAEMPALEDFVLEEILVAEGGSVKVGQALARIRDLDGRVSTRESAANTEETRPVDGPINRIKASPAARRVARELMVELASLSGTGPRGRITTEDVRNANANVNVFKPVVPPTSPTISPPTPQAQKTDTTGHFHRFTRTELAAAKVTVQSKAEIPHFYVRVRADVTGLMRGFEIERAKGAGFTINDCLVRAVALALTDHPRLNAVLEPDGLRLLPKVHIGVMTVMPEGLITSVVPEADHLSLPQINARVREVRARAASGRARSEDVSGASFCISNLGMFGVEEFSAIILPPNVAILAVGALTDELVATDGSFRIAKTLRLTVSADHRAVDGAEVALFLQSLRKLLEHPSRLFG